MPNHVHLIVVPGQESVLSRAIGEAHRRYTRHINLREKWRGYLWQGRFASFPMDEPYLLSAARYVELNPVKASIVEDAWGYRWSSVHAHLSGRGDGVVKVKPLLNRVDDWRGFIADPGEKPGTQYRFMLRFLHGKTSKSGRCGYPASHHPEREPSTRGFLPGRRLPRISGFDVSLVSKRTGRDMELLFDAQSRASDRRSGTGIRAEPGHR